MEKKLRQLFDYQKFQNTPRVENMLSEAEARYEGSLSDDDLELVSAAGDGFLMNHVYPLEQLEADIAARDQAAVPGSDLSPEKRL